MSISPLPLDSLQLIKQFASDKLGVHPTAALIKDLRFETIEWIHDCTFVYTDFPQYFIKHIQHRYINRSNFVRFRYDIKKPPEKRRIDLVWDIWLQE